MKKLKLILSVLSLVILFTAIGSTGHSAQAHTKQKVESAIETPTQIKLEHAEAYKVDDAEFTTAVVCKSGFPSGSFIQVGLLASLFIMLAAVFRPKIMLSMLTVAFIASYFIPNAEGLSLAFILPAVPAGNNLKAFRDALGLIQKRMDEILSSMEKENRSFNPEETKEYGELEIRYSEIEAKFKIIEANEKRKKSLAGNAPEERQIPGDPGSGKDLFGKQEVRNINENFSLGRALTQRWQGRSLDGIEKEIEDEGIKQSPIDVKIDRGYHVPWFMVEPTGIDDKAEKRTDKKREKRMRNKKEYRTVTIGTEGGDVMQVNLGELIPALRPSVITETLGVRFLMGLNGDFQFPRKSSVSSVTWLTESGNAAASTPAFDNIKLSPKRAAGYIDLSRQSMIQSVFAMEDILRQDLETELGIELDYQALNGSGTSNKPTGIINTAGVGTVSNGTNGGALTWAQVLSFLSQIWVANVPENSLKWLTTMQEKAKLMSTDKTAGYGRYILDDPYNAVAGYPFLATNQLPSNGTKGSGTNLSSAIFGNWSEAYVGMFGGVNLIFDTLTQKEAGNIRLYIEQFMDVKLRHAASFVVSTDIVHT